MNVTHAPCVQKLFNMKFLHVKIFKHENNVRYCINISMVGDICRFKNPRAQALCNIAAVGKKWGENEK